MSTLGSCPLQNTEDCYTTINPNHADSGAPARMFDGRLFTDYRPRCHQYSVKAAQTWGDNAYRQRMIHGADELMEIARQMNNRKATAATCVDTMVPELYKRVCTWQGCKVVPGNHTGIGVGRIYVPSVESAADDPQMLSDISVPAIFGTYPRVAPKECSDCAVGEAETQWCQKPAIEQPAKVHPYSAPRA
jgi:hypothetical protein